VRDLVNPVRDLFDATAHHYALKLTCRHCRRQRIFPAAAVWWHFKRRGFTDRLRDVPQRFRCQSCERRGPTLDLVHEEANDASLPLPSEQDWKHELRRRR
jgi:hypothetical protein